MSSGENVNNVAAYGYTFGSLMNQSQLSQIAGSDQGNQTIHLSVTNYANPLSPSASLMVFYNTKSCIESAVEGGQDYPGYNYYRTLLENFYSSGIPIYFQYVTCPDPEYGECLEYTAIPPWFNPDLPRNITYTLSFQNSTGYLLDYVLKGTEMCCYNNGESFCPNEGLCADGSIPQKIYTVSGSYYRNYALFTSWDENFFQVTCPYNNNSQTSSTTTTSSTTSVSAGDAVGIAFGSAILGFIIGMILRSYTPDIFFWKKRTPNLLKTNDRSELLLSDATAIYAARAQLNPAMAT